MLSLRIVSLLAFARRCLLPRILLTVSGASVSAGDTSAADVPGGAAAVSPSDTGKKILHALNNFHLPPKAVIFGSILLFLALLVPAAVLAEENAEELTHRCALEAPGYSRAAYRLQKSGWNSYQIFHAGAVLSVSWIDDVPAKALCLQWRVLPKGVTLPSHIIDAYSHTPENLSGPWLRIAGLTLCFIVLTFIALKILKSS